MPIFQVDYTSNQQKKYVVSFQLDASKDYKIGQSTARAPFKNQTICNQMVQSTLKGLKPKFSIYMVAIDMHDDAQDEAAAVMVETRLHQPSYAGDRQSYGFKAFHHNLYDMAHKEQQKAVLKMESLRSGWDKTGLIPRRLSPEKKVEFQASVDHACFLMEFANLVTIGEFVKDLPPSSQAQSLEESQSVSGVGSYDILTDTDALLTETRTLTSPTPQTEDEMFDL